MKVYPLRKIPSASRIWTLGCCVRGMLTLDAHRLPGSGCMTETWSRYIAFI